MDHEPSVAQDRQRVLLVSPSFFGYEQDIADAFRAEGARVTTIDERPGNSPLMRAALRLRLRGTAGLVDRHFREAYARLDDRIDLVVVVKGESVPVWFLDRLRADRPGVRIVYYSYDRIGPKDNCLDLIPLCDEAYSFDPADVAARGLSYKPLFHGPAFVPGLPLAERDLDVSFVGTAHSDRYAYATGIAAAVPRSDLFFYSQARWYFAWQRRFGALRGVPWSAVSFTKRSKEDVAATFRRSRAVIDLQRAGQAGLTMRTFEVLASGAKLITTNPHVLDLPGIDPAQVLVLGVDEVPVSAERIRRFVTDPAELEPLDARYGLRAWVRSLLRPAEATTAHEGASA